MRRISIEGNLAAGKSTFLAMLETIKYDNSYEIAPEPVAQWQHVEDKASIAGEDLPLEMRDEEKADDTNILSLFYKDPKRWAHTFQLYAFSSRLRHQRQTCRSDDTKFLLMERSMESDKRIFARNCFITGLMNRVEYAIYNDLHSYWTENAPTLDAIIYLQTPPDICFERLFRRHRGEEMSITLEYMEQIHRRHEEWLCDSSKFATSPDEWSTCREDGRTPLLIIPNAADLDDARKLDLILLLDTFLKKISLAVPAKE